MLRGDGFPNGCTYLRCRSTRTTNWADLYSEAERFGRFRSILLYAAEEGPGFNLGQRVRHRAFGYGEVREIEGDRVLVHFPKRKKKLTVRAEYLKAA